MSTRFGYQGKILYIDLSSQSIRVEEPTESWYRLYAGGGLLATCILLRDTRPGLDAFDQENRLIFTSSIIAGQNAPGLARFSVVCKSPLSGGIAETRCEGPFGHFLKGSGYDALVLTGRAAAPVYLLLEQGQVRFLPADDLWGQDTGTTTRCLTARHGPQAVQVAAIGPAGENRVRYASIVTASSIQAMRMGTGAVMGSKQLKALVLKGVRLPEVAKPDELAGIAARYEELMLQNTLSLWQKEPPGFSASADLSDLDTAYIGSNNYQTNLSVGTSNYMRSKYLPFYRGDISCPGCPNQCIKIIDPGLAEPASAGIHQEASGALGPNIGNGDLKLMLEANVLCNLYGIDPVSLGFTISFAMECLERGLIDPAAIAACPFAFGQCENLLRLIDLIARRQGIGSLLAEGSRLAARSLGRGAEAYALQVKGVEMVSFEPRTQTGLALGYATAPIGPRYDICEHDWDFDVVTGWEHTLNLSRTLGIFDRTPMQAIGPDKVRRYKALNTIWSACDSLDLCIFASAPTRIYSLEMIAALIRAITGWETSAYEFMRWGDRRNHLMRVYNLREGLTKADDSLPERFFSEPIAYGRLAGTVLDHRTFQAAIDCYYQMMGWDKDGRPLPATLQDFNLEWTLEPGYGIPGAEENR